MSVLWMGLSIFAIILIGFFIIMGLTKGAFFLVKGQREEPLHSNWVPLQVYSGDNHPDLKTMSELKNNK